MLANSENQNFRCYFTYDCYCNIFNFASYKILKYYNKELFTSPNDINVAELIKKV